MKKTILAFLAVLPLITYQARATDYTYSDTIDLGSISNITQYNWYLNAPAISFVSGDTISGIISFAHNDRLQFDNMGGDYFNIWTRYFSAVNVNGGSISAQTTLLNFQGIIGAGPASVNSGGGAAFALSPSFFISTADNSFSFSGIQYSATINSINGGVFNADPGLFLSAQVLGSHGNFSVVSAVPEPSTYALFGLGALALVIATRRRAF